jgi:response regulator of citrate/malate metabolism
MAFREVTLQEVKEVVRLWRARVPKKRIAAQLGLDIKTVRRYLRALEEGAAEPDLDAATGAIVEAVSSARG